MSSKVLDSLHHIFGTMLVAVSVAGLGALAYGTYSITVLRRASVAQKQQLALATGDSAVPPIASAPVKAADSAPLK